MPAGHIGIYAKGLFLRQVLEHNESPAHVSADTVDFPDDFITSLEAAMTDRDVVGAARSKG